MEGNEERLKDLARAIRYHGPRWWTGEFLTEARSLLDHGEWLPWLKENGWGARSAQLAMNAYAEMKRRKALRTVHPFKFRHSPHDSASRVFKTLEPSPGKCEQGQTKCEQQIGKCEQGHEIDIVKNAKID